MISNDVLTTEGFPNCKNGKYYIAVTHNGLFHADDIFAAALLKLAFGDKIIFKRSRDEVEFEKADIVFDVGKKYDEVKYFDHHQDDYRLIEPTGLKHSALTLLAKKLIRDKEVLIEFNRRIGYPIAARDNGQELANTISVFYTTPSGWVQYFNMSWREQEEFNDPNDRYSYFDMAVQTAMLIIERVFICIIDELNVTDLVRAYADKAQYNGSIMVIDRYLPFMNTIVKEYKEIKFVIYPNINTGTFMLQSVPISLDDKFKNKVLLPKLWRGFKQESWDKPLYDGLDGCIYVHNNGYIGSWDTVDHAIIAARNAIMYNEVI